MRSERDSLLSLLLPAAIGLAAGALIVYSMVRVPFKWTLFLVVITGAVSIGILVGATTRFLKQTLLFFAVLSLPIFYKITFMFVKDLPYEVSANGFPISLFDAFMIPLLLFWVHELLFDPNSPPVRLPKGWLLPLMLLFLINLVSCFLAPAPFFSYSTLYLHAKGYLILLYLANNIRDEQTVKVIGLAFAGVLIMEGVIVLEQTLVGVIFTAENLGRTAISLQSRVGMGYIVRVAGTLTHPNALAMYLNLILPWVGFLFLIEKRFSLRVLLMSAVVLALLAEIWSGSRGAWMGLGLAVVTGVFLWMRKQGRNPVLGLGAAAGILLLLFSVMFAASAGFRARLTEGDAGTALVRVPLMEVAKVMIMANPVMGVGLNNYTHEMKRYDHTLERISTWYGQAVHNTWMQMAAETGIPSLFVFVYTYFFLFLREAYRVFRKHEGVLAALGIGVVCMLVAWTLHNMVNATAPYDEFTLWVLFGLVAAASRMTPTPLLPQGRTTLQPRPRI